MPDLQRITRRINRDPEIQSDMPPQKEFWIFTSQTDKPFDWPGTIHFFTAAENNNR
jgi:hypothetical protein